MKGKFGRPTKCSTRGCYNTPTVYFRNRKSGKVAQFHYCDNCASRKFDFGGNLYKNYETFRKDA